MIGLATPSVVELDGVFDALREWQADGASSQLHPGDLGWHWRFGAEAAAAAVRTWSRGPHLLAVGMVDSRVLRLAIAPDARDDDELARQLVADLDDPERGVAAETVGAVEAPRGARVRDLLGRAGWQPDEPWTPLRRDLTDAVETPGVRIEVVGPEQVPDRVAVQRAAFDRSTFTEERWHEMSRGPAYGEARCLVAYDARDVPVAAITVWSAGRGRPGLVEPMGVHRDHRRRGHGRAVTLAGAAVLRDLGSSSAVVCTPTSNTGAVGTYAAAGFDLLPATQDLRRPG